jgi:hypothetical protein
LRTSAQKISALGLAVQRALSECEAAEGVNALFVKPERVLIPLFFVALIAARAPWVGLAMLIAGLLFAGYRAHMTFRARDIARSRWRLLRRNASAFVRDGRDHAEQGSSHT